MSASVWSQRLEVEPRRLILARCAVSCKRQLNLDFGIDTIDPAYFYTVADGNGQTTTCPKQTSMTSRPKAARQSDVIYGRKFGVALTMEVFTAATRNGIGVVWVVSSPTCATLEHIHAEHALVVLDPSAPNR